MGVKIIYVVMRQSRGGDYPISMWENESHAEEASKARGDCYV